LASCANRNSELPLATDLRISMAGAVPMDSNISSDRLAPTLQVRGLIQTSIKCPNYNRFRSRLEPDDLPLRAEILRFLSIVRHTAHLLLIGMAQPNNQSVHGVARGRIDLGLDVSLLEV